MNTLAIDIETKSSNSLKAGGVYKYIESPDFDILLFAYSLNKSPVQVIDMTDGRGLPDQIHKFLFQDNCKKSAWNAQFERACLGKVFGHMPPSQWECTMVKATMLGLPRQLEQAGRALSLKLQKDKEGSQLLRYFTVPCKPTAVNGYRNWNNKYTDPEKWQRFIAYCKRDVEAEREIAEMIEFFKVRDTDRDLWELDQQINDRGIFMDLPMIRSTMKVDFEHRKKVVAEAIEITGVNNPNSVAQLRGWLQEEMPEETIEKLRKEDIPVLKELAADYQNEDTIKRVLEIRQTLSKTSVKKYQAMVNVRGSDGRARGLFQYYGANRTGRWAGRLVQMQNLPKTSMQELDRARKVACMGKDEVFDLVDFLDEDGDPMTVPQVLSQLIRTAFIPKPGHKFVVVDSSAIEARILSWLADEDWRMEVFRTHGKIYEASAAMMFNKPIEQVTTDDRGRGKVAELALGYQGGPNAMIRMDLKKKVRKLAIKKWGTASQDIRFNYRYFWDKRCIDAKKKLLTEEELLEEFIFAEYQAIVKAWRPANPNIGLLWNELDAAAIDCVLNRCGHSVSFVKMFVSNGIFLIRLPSGRLLSYLRPKIATKIVRPVKGDPFEVTGLAYMGVDQVRNVFGYEHTYGGKLTENICQAIARDCLGYWLQQAGNAGYNIVAHVHDEIVIEVREKYAENNLADVIEMMSQEIPWAPGLPLAAAGFVTDYYKKD